jgi:hypothetical protein
VPGPFSIEAVLTERDGFKLAVGWLELAAHPLSGKWIVLSQIQAMGTWGMSHVCIFEVEPSIPEDLGSLIASAPLTGFARAAYHST